MTVTNQHPAAEVAAEFPLSAAQLQFWLQDQFDPGTAALNIAVRWGLKGAFHADVLERAFHEVILRHEILRTRFVATDTGEPIQQVLGGAAFKLNMVDLRATPRDQHDARLRQIAQEDSAKPFDLAQPCQLRVTMVRLSTDRAELLITAHHIIFDGYSIGVMGRELGQIAGALEAGQTPNLEELPLQYGDASLWQQEVFAAGALDEDAAYWKEQLKGAAYLELPTDRPRPPVRSSDAEVIQIDLPDNFGTRVDDLARTQQVSPFALGSAVIAACLHRATGQSDVSFATPTASRNEVELESLIGVFINTLMLRMTPSGDIPFTTLLAQAKHVVEGAVAHQTIPFAEVVTRLNAPRDASRTPLVSINFHWARVFMQEQHHGAFDITSHPSHSPGAAYDLNIQFVGRPNGWRLHLDYVPALYDRATMDALIEQITQSFEMILSNPGVQLNALPGLHPQARAKPTNLQVVPQPTLEAVLMQHPLVHSVAVLETAQGAYAYVTPPVPCYVPLETLPPLLNDFVGQHLAADALPVGISVLQSLPDDLSLIGNAPAGSLNTPTAPQADDIGRVLQGIWADCLSVSDIPPDASFFDLGGSSLQAIRLLSRMRREWALDLTIVDVYQNPSLTQMSQFVQSKLGVDTPQDHDDWRIVPLMAKGKTPQLIGFNNIGTMLATAQQPTCERKATCVRLFDGQVADDIAGLKFEQIAAKYAEVVKRAQPSGPYVLFGLCVHGNLALEAARILRAEGHTVTVVLKDVWEPTYFAGLRANRRQRWREKFHALGERYRRVRDGSMSLGAALGSYRLIRTSGLLHILSWLGIIDRVRKSDLDPLQEDFTMALAAARDVYRPAPYDGDVLHVVTRFSPTGRGFKPSIGWEDIVTGPLKTVFIDEVLVSGNREIGIEELAQEIERFLKESR